MSDAMAVVWFRLGLRLIDNPALEAAAGWRIVGSGC